MVEINPPNSDELQELQWLLEGAKPLVPGQKIPLPPKGRISYPNKWWSEKATAAYWGMTVEEYRQLIKDYEQNQDQGWQILEMSRSKMLEGRKKLEILIKVPNEMIAQAEKES